jgi:hypothetical protein
VAFSCSQFTVSISWGVYSCGRAMGFRVFFITLLRVLSASFRAVGCLASSFRGSSFFMGVCAACWF